MERFAAKLLFQLRVDVKPRAAKRRTCEERIINFRSSGALNAVEHALRYGRSNEHQYVNTDGATVFVEFVGVLDIAHLGIECGPEEVWYDIRERLLPRERAAQLVLSREQLIGRLSQDGA